MGGLLEGRAEGYVGPRSNYCGGGGLAPPLPTPMYMRWLVTKVPNRAQAVTFTTVSMSCVGVLLSVK